MLKTIILSPSSKNDEKQDTIRHVYYLSSWGSASLGMRLAGKHQQSPEMNTADLPHRS